MTVWQWTVAGNLAFYTIAAILLMRVSKRKPHAILRRTPLILISVLLIMVAVLAAFTYRTESRIHTLQRIPPTRDYTIYEQATANTPIVLSGNLAGTEVRPENYNLTDRGFIIVNQLNEDIEGNRYIEEQFSSALHIQLDGGRVSLQSARGQILLTGNLAAYQVGNTAFEGIRNNDDVLIFGNTLSDNRLSIQEIFAGDLGDYRQYWLSEARANALLWSIIIGFNIVPFWYFIFSNL